MSTTRQVLTSALAAAGITASSLAAPSAPMSAAVETTPSVIRFDKSQKAMFEDEARVIVVVWHRQKGKDFTAAAKAVRHALRTGQTWFIVSITQRQADATFDKCKRVAKALMSMLQIDGEAEDGPGFVNEEYDKELKQAFTFLAREIRLPGGGRVVSLPGRDPDTLAGLTGNVIFTEFGLFPNGGYAHWRVVFPLTTRGFQCIVISTPRGKNTKFYELFVNTDGAYSIHFCDIHKSMREDGFVLRDNNGLPTDVATFKKLYGDAAGFEREYECKFSGDASSLITWAELERAASLANPHGFRFLRIDKGVPKFDARNAIGALYRKPLAIGWDVARRGDLSAVSVNVLDSAGGPASLTLVIAMHDCEFSFMRGVVSSVMDISYASVGYGDATGLGMESNETLQKKYGERWTPHTFSSKGKLEVASALKTAFTDGSQTLPPLADGTKLIGTDLYAIQKDDTTERMTISETPNPLLDESHCDIAYSIGLARLAGANAAVLPLPRSLARKPIGL